MLDLKSDTNKVASLDHVTLLHYDFKSSSPCETIPDLCPESHGYQISPASHLAHEVATPHVVTEIGSFCLPSISLP